MGILPATGTEISMGKVAVAYGIHGGYPPPAGSNIRLSGTLGPEIGITSGSETSFSEDFGGKTTPNDYP